MDVARGLLLVEQKAYLLSAIFLCFHHLHCTNLQRKSEQGDESGCVMVIVKVAGREACQRFIVKAVRRGCAGLDDIALVKLELYFSGHVLLGGLYECLDGLAQRGEPFSFVNDLCELAAELLLCLHGLTVKDQLLELVMCGHQDGSAGSLVDAAGLHADDAVLHDIDDADAVLAAQLVQRA